MGIELEKISNLEYRLRIVEEELRSLRSLLLDQEVLLTEIKDVLDSIQVIRNPNESVN